MRMQDREELISENLQRERRKGRERRQREHKGREKGRAKGQWGRRDKQRIEVKREDMEEERKRGVANGGSQGKQKQVDLCEPGLGWSPHCLSVSL